MAEPTKGDLSICRVCGDKATELHNNVPTCDSCSLLFDCFYRPSGTIPPCPKDGKCLIVWKLGNTNCVSCLLIRALSVGMKKSPEVPNCQPTERKFSTDNSDSTFKGSPSFSQSNFPVNSTKENSLKKRTTNDCTESARKKSINRNRKRNAEATKCRVCDEDCNNIGFYYEAIICDACQRFFFEVHNLGRPIDPCENNQRCLIDKENRWKCRACRLNKCHEVGMKYSLYSASTLEGPPSSSQSNFTVNSTQENSLKKKTTNDCTKRARKKSRYPKRKRNAEATKCRVCDDDCDIRFYYEAINCDACRRFFFEVHNLGRPIDPCKNNQRCLIDKENRWKCRACRLNKCHEVGMKYSS